MASGAQRLKNTSKPSSAFLIKCAKEKEKLRSRLQKQLQKHMLYAWETASFADLTVKLCDNLTDSSPCKNLENHTLVSTHSSVLGIRVPSFYNELVKERCSEDFSTVHVSSLGENELKTFLRKVYTDDDIRRDECDILRVWKKCGAENDNEFEKDTCNLEGTEISKIISNGGVHEFYSQDLQLQDNALRSNFTEKNIEVADILANVPFEKDEESGDSLELKCKKQIPKQLDVVVVYKNCDDQEENNMNQSPRRKLVQNNDSNLSPSLSNVDKADDTPSPLSTSSLVRSSTFDLQCPLALETVLDAEEEAAKKGESNNLCNDSKEVNWNRSNQQQNNDYKEMMLNTTREIQQCISGNTSQDNPVQSFFLHRHHVPTDHAMHCSTSDGSLADSGILTQSLFSDTDVVTSSLPSSLVNSFEGCQAAMINTVNKLDNAEQNKIENDKYIEPPSPMFPMYFEIPVQNVSHPNTIDSNGNVPPDGFYRGSTKTMDLIAELPPDRGSKVIKNEDVDDESVPVRPQSCYMFIDLETVAKEEDIAAVKKKQQEQSSNKKLQSLSMFIDFTKDNKEVVSEAQKKYKQFATNRSVSAIGQRELRKPSYDGIPDLIQNKNSLENVLSISRKGSLDAVIQKDCEEQYALQLSPVSSSVKSKIDSRPATPAKILNDKIEFKGKSMAMTQPEKCKSTFTEDQIKSSPRKDKSVKSGGIDEDGLLPMSPIMRRKTVKKDKPKVEPVEVQVKASTKPQDIDAMKFHHSVSETEGLETAEEVLVLIQDKKNSSLTLVPAVSSSQDNAFTVTVYDSEAKLGQPPEETNSISPTHNSSPEGEQNQTEVKTLGWCDSLERPTQKYQLASFEGDDDSETIYSEVSDVSSTVLQAIGGAGTSAGSSFVALHCQGQSPEGSREQNVGAYGSIRVRALEACSKLGEDLLRMFLEEISWDIIVQVDGREIKAHKCILVSRCKYFAAMLNGEWSESSGNKINLQGFSYPVVHFALCHIYSGAINLPKDLSVPELALLADMLVLDTLKDVIVFYLKMNHCHFFHKPCNHCLVGVVECLPIAVQCSLKELHNKAVRWIGKNFIRVWPTKAFASLSDELKEQCYQQTLLNMSVETVIDMTLNCDRLMSTIPHVKWAEPVFGLVTRLLEDCIHFMAGKFDEVLASDGFMALGKSQSWNVAALEDSVLSSVELVNPDSACRTFIQLNRLIPITHGSDSGLLNQASNISPIDHGEWTQNFLDLLLRIQRHCERYLIHNANKVVHCQSWALLAPEVQKKIKDAAVIVFEFEKPTAPPPRLTSLQRKQKNPEDKSLTFPRKAQVVRGKKTSKSFRERSTDHKETEVKRPLPPDGGVKSSSQNNLSLEESMNQKLILEKEMAIPRISRRRASEGYYKVDALQRSYEEEDEDDTNSAELSHSIVDDPPQDELPLPSPPPPETEIIAIEDLPPPADELLLVDDTSETIEKEQNVTKDIPVVELPTEINIIPMISPSEPPVKPPRRSVILDNGYDLLKEPKPVTPKEKSRSPRREPPLPPHHTSSSIPVPKSPTCSVRSTSMSTASGHYSKPMKHANKVTPDKLKYTHHDVQPKPCISAEEDDDDSSGYEKVWVGVTGAPYVKDELSPTASSRTDLVAEIDQETMLVNSCLHEAEALELAIAKKMQCKQHKLEKMINSSTYSVTHHHHHSQAGLPNSSPVVPKSKSNAESRSRNSDNKSVASTQLGSRNSLKKNVEHVKVKRSNSKATEPAPSAKPKITCESSATQTDIKSTKNSSVIASVVPVRTKASPASSSSVSGQAPVHKEKHKMNKK